MERMETLTLFFALIFLIYFLLFLFIHPREPILIDTPPTNSAFT